MQTIENNAEATAFAVRLLAKVDAKSPLLPAAAQWLMLNRDGGVWWDSTEQTAMVLFGLVDYLAVSHELELTSPRRSWSTAAPSASVTSPRPMRQRSVADGRSRCRALQPDGNQIQIKRSSGTGRVYWSIGGATIQPTRASIRPGRCR